MQTFLPIADFVESAKVLDYKRLGKQRLECKQILQAIYFNGGWASHPATKMWRGYERALGEYWLTMCREWAARGYTDNMSSQAGRFLASMQSVPLVLPHWFGCEKFHASHRSNLLRKNPTHYEKFGWSEGPHLPYVWPDRSYVPLTRKIGPV